MAQQRADDAVLPGRRAGNAARVRPGRPAGTPAVHASPGGRAGRDGDPDRDLPVDQRGPSERARLGGGHVDRHGPRPGPARRAGPRRPGPDARLRAHRLRGRRPGRAAGHRGVLQRPDQLHAAGRGARRVRAAAARGQVPAAAALGVRGPRHRDVGRAADQRGRPGGGGPGHRARRAGVHAGARRTGGRDGAGPPFPRAADTRIRPFGAGGPGVRSFTERTSADVLPPVDQLRDRAVVRPGQRGNRGERGVPGPGVRGPGHARRADRLRGRQADRRDRQFLGRHPAEPRADPPADRGRRGGREWHHRRDRLHGGAADRHARVPGCGTGRGQARRAVGRVRGRTADVGRAQRGPPAPGRPPARVSCSATPG